MNWIWTTDSAEAVNAYAEFRQDFSSGSGPIILKLSVTDEYAVFVNGEFVACGQYDDYPKLKCYDTLDLRDFCRNENNTLLIKVYCQGSDSAQCIADTPKLWYQLETEYDILESSSETLCRSINAYDQGECEILSPQLSFTFHYDARQENTLPWQQAVVLDCKPELYPRPIKKLTVHPPMPSKLRNQGVFLSDPACLPTPADRIYTDLTAPRYPWDMIRYTPPARTHKVYADPPLPLPGKYTVEPQTGYDGTYVIVDLGRELAGFVHLELDAAPGTVFDIAYGEHLEDGRVRAKINNRHFAFSYTASTGRQSFTHWYKRFAGRYLELHARTKEAFTLYNLTLQEQEYPLTTLPRPSCLTDPLTQRIYDVSVDTLKLCMHEHYEDCPWREQAMYAMDSRNQALAGFYAFGEYDYPKACWQLYEPGLRSDGMFPLTVPSANPKTIPSFNLAWVIACGEWVRYSGEGSTIFTATMEKVLDAFSERLDDGILTTFDSPQYWNYFEWADGLSGNNGKADAIQKSAALTLFYYAALQAYDRITPSGRYALQAEAVRNHFHATFWDDNASAYRTFSDNQHFTELVQALALWCELVPESSAPGLRRTLADPQNGWVKTTLSHYIYKIDALMQEPDIYYPVIHQQILDQWGQMLFSGATTFWETMDGGDGFSKAGSLCHGWSAIPVYFWHKYKKFSK